LGIFLYYFTVSVGIDHRVHFDALSAQRTVLRGKGNVVRNVFRPEKLYDGNGTGKFSAENRSRADGRSAVIRYALFTVCPVVAEAVKSNTFLPLT